jgi:lipoprotein-releasing system ATP-binding protein
MSESKTPILTVRGVRRSFQAGERRLEVLHGVNLDLAAHGRLCLMGSSGAGKTTLLNIIGLLDRPDEGKVMLQGQDAWNLPSSSRAGLRNRVLGFVFQFYHLLPELDALENTTLPARLAGARGARLHEYRSKAKGTLEAFGLGERLHHRPGKLSGGEQQRVAIARALLMEPKLLIADEPTGNLDRSTGDRVLDLLFEEQQKRGFALLLVTHDQRLAKRCERIVHMEDGQIQADSTTPIPH